MAEAARIPCRQSSKGKYPIPSPCTNPNPNPNTAQDPQLPGQACDLELNGTTSRDVWAKLRTMLTMMPRNKNYRIPLPAGSGQNAGLHDPHSQGGRLS